MSEDLRAIDFVEHGQDSGQGSLLGIQPFMERDDYSAEEAFFTCLDGYFQQAEERGWIGERTVVVLPEHLGTWLVAAGESAKVREAATLTAAMQPLAMCRPLAFLRELVRAKENDRASAALLRLRAGAMAQSYQSVFSRLARKYRATIVAGSILLPSPEVSNGQVQAGKGPIYNASFLFRPDGHADSRIARKIYPIDTELSFVTPAGVDDLPVYDTPAGRLGVLVCADAWYPATYERLRELGVELVAVPSAIPHGQQIYQPWDGYSGWPVPDDISKSDIGAITLRQAWGRYALAGRMPSCAAKAGINVFLYGNLWDQEFDGGRWRMVKGDADVEAARDGAAVINLWL